MIIAHEIWICTAGGLEHGYISNDNTLLQIFRIKTDGNKQDCDEVFLVKQHLHDISLFWFWSVFYQFAASAVTNAKAASRAAAVLYRRVLDEC